MSCQTDTAMPRRRVRSSYLESSPRRSRKPPDESSAAFSSCVAPTLSAWGTVWEFVPEHPAAILRDRHDVGRGRS